MSDELLSYYEKELAFLRKSGADFAQSHPKIAGRLRINADIVEDPHVSRLLEGVAYLNARIQHKLDDEFPELTDALFNVMYPHYLRPIPSFTIVQFRASKDLDSVFQVAAGTQLETESFQGKTCKFITCYPVELVPVTIQEASLQARPFIAPGANQIQEAGAILHLNCQALSPKLALAESGITRLRLFLKGQVQQAYPIHRMLLNETVRLVVARSEHDTQPIYLDTDRIRPVGYGADEGMIPYPPQSFIGYRLLTEFFCFPEKFMFVDIDLQGVIDADFAQQLHLYFYVQRSSTELERVLSAENFALGCAPMVNLFPQQADPLRLTHTQREYQVIPDARIHEALEVYSIDDVSATHPDGKTVQYHPFYGVNHDLNQKDQSHFWYAQRRDCSLSATPEHDGTEVFISLTDLKFRPQTSAAQTLSIRTHCLNRDLPSKLPFGGGQPHLSCIDAAPPVSRIECLTPPTHTLRPELGNRARWRLLSHLNMNHLSLSGQGNATEALREILRLYDFNESAAVRTLINSIHQVSTDTMTAPIRLDGKTTLCRGTQVTVIFDEANLAGNSAFLFASVLERFLGIYCSINSFTRLVAKIKGKDGVLKRWPPRVGEKSLV